MRLYRTDNGINSEQQRAGDHNDVFFMLRSCRGERDFGKTLVQVFLFLRGTILSSRCIAGEGVQEGGGGM